MKVKTSITLSSDLLEELDRVAGDEPRSAFIENVLRAYLRRREREEGDARDLELINAAADRLNAEAEDVLLYQVLPDEDE
jgi:metal-responsive CopG/Arc/MetJ family transcriptional regulator